MKNLQNYQRFESLYVTGFIVLFFAVNNTILASSVIMEAQRAAGPLPFKLWEPYVWEYTSAVATALLIPIIILLNGRYPLQWCNYKTRLPFYALVSILFSLFHVGIMVVFREFIYWTQGMDYDFGKLYFELFYEYRKDLWSFILLLMAINTYQFILCRLRGEAAPIAEGEDSEVNEACERLLVKKLGKEFIIRVEDIEWLEASGNYVNLHIDGRAYPIRSTLSGLIEKIESKGFSRVHRSHAVNLNVIDSIEPQASGDSDIKLRSGKVLTLSRRYKDQFKMQL